MPFREDLPTLWRHVVASVPRKRRECSDGLHQNLLRKMTVALRHTKVRMTRELLDGVRGMADDFRTGEAAKADSGCKPRLGR